MRDSISLILCNDSDNPILRESARSVSNLSFRSISSISGDNGDEEGDGEGGVVCGEGGKAVLCWNNISSFPSFGDLENMF